MKYLIALFTLLPVQGVFAASTPATCNTIRTAKATITIWKNYWVQTNGAWTQQQTQLATATSDVPVVQDDDSACSFQNILLLDNEIFNGQPQTVRFYAHVHVITAASGQTPNKVFHSSYTVLSDNNKAAFSNSYTPDLTAQYAGVNYSETYTNANPSPHEDRLDITVWFNDSNAAQ